MSFLDGVDFWLYGRRRYRQALRARAAPLKDRTSAMSKTLPPERESKYQLI